MQNLNQAIQESLKNIDLQDIAIKAAVGEVEKAVKEAVKKQMSGWSDFSTQLEKHIASQLTFDVSAIKLPAYRDFIIGAVNNTLASFVNEDHAKEIAKYVNSKVVGESRDEIEFSTFWDELCSMIDDDCEDTDNRKYSVVFGQNRESYSYSRTYHDLTISLNKDDSSYSSKDKSEVIYAAFSDGKIYHMRINDDFELSAVATWLKSLKFRKTKITDPGSEDVNLPQRDW